MAGRTQSNFGAPFGVFGVSGILFFGIAYSVCHTSRQSQRKMEKLQTTGANQIYLFIYLLIYLLIYLFISQISVNKITVVIRLKCMPILRLKWIKTRQLQKQSPSTSASSSQSSTLGNNLSGEYIIMSIMTIFMSFFASFYGSVLRQPLGSTRTISLNPIKKGFLFLF